MKRVNYLTLISHLVILIFTYGCVTTSPLKTHFENNFTSFPYTQKDKVKSTSIKRNFQNSHEEVWDNVLYILTQNTVITSSSRESGIISYIDIDGVFFTGVLNEDQFLYWEFPFTVWVERNEQKGSTVYIYPMTYFYPEKIRRKSWWDTVETGFYQKGEKFLEILSVQLAAQERWPWLDR